MLLYSTHPSTPNQTITTVICSLVCSDPSITPLVRSEEPEIQVEQGQVELQVEQEKGMNSRRGAEYVLEGLCQRLGGALFDTNPFLSDCIVHPLVDFYETTKKGNFNQYNVLLFK